jgi:hypothetical protein
VAKLNLWEVMHEDRANHRDCDKLSSHYLVIGRNIGVDQPLVAHRMEIGSAATGSCTVPEKGMPAWPVTREHRIPLTISCFGGFSN